jgi:hypothetical protein
MAAITVQIDPTGATNNIVIRVNGNALEVTRDEWKELKRRVTLAIRPARTPRLARR